MAMNSGAGGQSHKAHRSRHLGASAKKKTNAKNEDQNSDQTQQNPNVSLFSFSFLLAMNLLFGFS